MSAKNEKVQKEAICHGTERADYYDDDEIDLAELFSALMKRKKLIIALTFGLAFLVAVYSLTIDNQYKASALLSPASSGSGSGMSKLAGQFGGLASLAGVSLPGGGTSVTQEAMAVLKSRKFLSKFIAENQLKPILFAESWDAEQQQWIVEPPGMIAQIKSAILPPAGPAETYPGQEILQPGEPSMWNAYNAFSGMIQVNEEKTSGLVTLSVEWINPLQARDWTNQLVKALNLQLKEESIQQSEKSIRFLETQLAEASNLEIRSILFKMIEEHTKSITLAKTSDEVAFKVLDPAVFPEQKSKPKRALMVAVGLVLGLMLGIFIALILNWREKEQVG